MSTTNTIAQKNKASGMQQGEQKASFMWSLGQLILALVQFLGAHFFTITLGLALYYGWSHRDSNYLSAETGAGYILGIVGGSMLLVLLIYPLSKRVALLTRWVPIRYWFGFHMLLGLIGPTLILFHSNFNLGSTNSSIALFSMLLVAGSGLIGRYIYARIHHGLYGTKLTLGELRQETETDHAELLCIYGMDETLNKSLNKMEEKVFQTYPGLLTSLLHVIYLAVTAHRLKLKVMRLVKENYNLTQDAEKIRMPEPDSQRVIQSIDRYTVALRETAAFKVYERLFALWHILHLPLFYMMIFTAIVHVFAVHLY